MQSINAILKDLNWEDIREWAGSKIYDRGKDYTDCVTQLSRTSDGTLVAWVSGSYDYATSVKYEGKDVFNYNCTCPYDFPGPCKHVIAVLLAAMERLRQGQDISLLAPEDDLYLEMFGNFDKAEIRENDEEDQVIYQPSVSDRGKGRFPEIENILSGKSREELLTLLIDLSLDYPGVFLRIQEMAQLETGQINKLVRSLSNEINRLTAEEVWFNSWKNEGKLPDYSHIEEQFKALAEKGHADVVFELGEDLWERGIKQLEQAYDEGETAIAMAACLEIVIRALPSTSLKPPEQLLWMIGHELHDEYNLMIGTEDVLNDPCYTEECWRDVAEALEVRLQNMSVPEGHFPESYRRRREINWLRTAYQRSGQQKKVIPLLEQEADRCLSYETLIEALLENGERDRARQWCIRGFEKTVENAPGIARYLQARLRQMAEEEGKFGLVAAYRIEEFFARPSEEAYKQVRHAAEKVNLWPEVRTVILDYLQTGRRQASDRKGENTWPLPETEVRERESSDQSVLESFPDREMLIKIAILEHRNDEVVSLYKELADSRRRDRSIGEQVASAVAGSHPERAIQIWKSIVDRLIGQVKPKAYQEAAGYLRQIRKVYERTGRLNEWNAWIHRLRGEHKAKRRLMDVLDGLES